MKAFVLKSMTFLGIYFLVINVSIMLLAEMTNLQDTFRLPQETRYLFLGNSRPETSINTKFIDSSYNFSKSAEAYFYTLMKAKKLLKENEFTNLKAVFVQFSGKSLSHYRDKWVWEHSYLQYNYPKYLPIMSWRDWYFLFKKNGEGLLGTHFSHTNLKLVSNILFHNLNEQKKYYGAYRPIYAKYKPKILDKINLAYKQGSIHETSLEQLIKLFNNRGIPVYLINCPTHRSNQIAEQSMTAQELMDYADIRAELIDFDHIRFPDSLYADRSHLNYDGAKKFSIFLDELLESGLLDQSNKQAFVDKAIMTKSRLQAKL